MIEYFNVLNDYGDLGGWRLKWLNLSIQEWYHSERFLRIISLRDVNSKMDLDFAIK